MPRLTESKREQFRAAGLWAPVKREVPEHWKQGAALFASLAAEANKEPEPLYEECEVSDPIFEYGIVPDTQNYPDIFTDLECEIAAERALDEYYPQEGECGSSKVDFAISFVSSMASKASASTALEPMEAVLSHPELPIPTPAAMAIEAFGEVKCGNNHFEFLDLPSYLKSCYRAVDDMANGVEPKDALALMQLPTGTHDLNFKFILAQRLDVYLAEAGYESGNQVELNRALFSGLCPSYLEECGNPDYAVMWPIISNLFVEYKDEVSFKTHILSGPTGWLMRKLGYPTQNCDLRFNKSLRELAKKAAAISYTINGNMESLEWAASNDEHYGNPSQFITVTDDGKYHLPNLGFSEIERLEACAVYQVYPFFSFIVNPSFRYHTFEVECPPISKADMARTYPPWVASDDKAMDVD